MLNLGLLLIGTSITLMFFIVCFFWWLEEDLSLFSFSLSMLFGFCFCCFFHSTLEYFVENADAIIMEYEEINACDCKHCKGGA